MCKSIKLTCINGKHVNYINMDTVESMVETGHGTTLVRTGLEVVTVVESPGEIMHKLKQLRINNQ